MKKIIIVLMLAGLCACTSQTRAKEFGGSASVNLPCNEKLVNVTFDEGHDLWYLSRTMKTDEQPETYILTEHSNWGIMQGSILFRECKK